MERVKLLKTEQKTITTSCKLKYVSLQTETNIVNSGLNIEKEDKVLLCVSRFYNVKCTDITNGENRSYPINIAKGMAAYLLRTYADCKISKIASILKMSERNVLYLLAKFKPLDTDKRYLANDYDSIMNNLSNK